MIAKATPVKQNDHDEAKGRKSEPFRRVKAEEYNQDALSQLNNSYHSLKNYQGSWGQKANSQLSSVQGRNFKHEKTKKKRGQYMGGIINMQVNSIKF